MRRSPLASAAIAIAVAAAVGCNGILGIEKAQVDPTLADAGAEAAAPSECSDYCATMAAHCNTPTSAEYVNAATCEKICATFDVGTAGELVRDTRECRLTHARLAGSSGDPTIECKKAGPTGGAGAPSCGNDPCHAFCVLGSELCAPIAAFPYANVADCTVECRNYAVDPGGEIAATSGNTFNCRVYHLEAAFETPAVHCPHIGKASATCQ